MTSKRLFLTLFGWLAKLYDSCPDRRFSSERGSGTYFATSAFAQEWYIQVINEKVVIPGIKARGPRIETKPNLSVIFPDTLDSYSPEIIIQKAIRHNAHIECEQIIRTVTPNARGRTVHCELPEEKLTLLLAWSKAKNVKEFIMCAELLRFWSPKEAETETTAPDEPIVIEKAASDNLINQAVVASTTVVGSAAVPASTEPMEVVATVESGAPALLAVSPTVAMAASATAASSAAAALTAVAAKTHAVASIGPLPTTVTAALTAISAEAASQAPAMTPAVALASFKFCAGFCGPLKASEEAVETKEVHNQSSLKLLEEYSSDEEIQFQIKKDESETEDGEVKDLNTSTPIDLAKSLERKVLRAREMARKKLDLSLPKNKVCIVPNKPQPDLAPVLEAEPRPRRSCAINSYLTDNYVLPSTKIVAKPAVANDRRSRSLLVTSKRLLDKTKAKAESPSITTFLKPRVASSEGFKNDVGEPKETLIKSQSDNSVSQKLISEFFPKNQPAKN